MMYVLGFSLGFNILFIVAHVINVKDYNDLVDQIDRYSDALQKERSARRNDREAVRQALWL